MSVERKKIITLDSNCFICKILISEPYIQCAVCQCVVLCISCFAQGQEKESHSNNHSYIIIKNDFILNESSDWTAEEERKLIELVQMYGFGNWIDISFNLLGKSENDCKEHYLSCYINNQLLPNLPKIDESNTSLFGSEITFYSYKLEELEDPPRLQPGSINCKLTAGYNAARSEFEYDFDIHSEQLIGKLKYNEFTQSDQCYKLARNLQIAIVHAYNARLKEKIRRKKVIKNHGLISIKKRLFYKYNTTVRKQIMDRLKVFVQISNGFQIDSIVECLYQIDKLKDYMRKIYNCRKNGLKFCHSMPEFEEILLCQEEFEKEKKNVKLVEHKGHKALLNVSSNDSFVSNSCFRKKASPIKIQGMIGYDKLSSSEQNLCSVIRIFPEVYLNYKFLLINENKKYGFVKLAQARQLLKIDVNKTKKIHELLINEGYLNV